MGLVVDIVDSGGSLEAARELAAELRDKPAPAMQHCKDLLDVTQSYEEYAQRAIEGSVGGHESSRTCGGRERASGEQGTRLRPRVLIHVRLSLPSEFFAVVSSDRRIARRRLTPPRRPQWGIHVRFDDPWIITVNFRKSDEAIDHAIEL